MPRTRFFGYPAEPPLIAQSVEAAKRVLKRRLQASSVAGATWGNIAIPNMEGRGTLDWVVDRCLMRPRYLIDLVNRCLGAAASREHTRIEADDFQQGYQSFSLDALVKTNLEIRDVCARSFDAVFALRGLKWRTSKLDISLALLNRGFAEEFHSEIIEILIWYGVLGAVDEHGEATFIYEVEYNNHVLEQLRSDREADSEAFEVNKAFWPALKIDRDGRAEGQMPLPV